MFIIIRRLNQYNQPVGTNCVSNWLWADLQTLFHVAYSKYYNFSSLRILRIGLRLQNIAPGQAGIYLIIVY